MQQQKQQIAKRPFVISESDLVSTIAKSIDIAITKIRNGEPLNRESSFTVLESGKLYNREPLSMKSSFTVFESAQILGYSPSKIYGLIRNGDLSFTTYGGTKFLSKSELQSWILNRGKNHR